MVSLDAGVNDVGAGSCAGAVVVGVASWATLTSRDTGKTPGGTGLGGVRSERHDSILLDEVDLICFLSVLILAKTATCMGVSDWATYTGIVTEELKGLGVDLAREALEGTLVDVLGLARQELETLINGGEGGDVLVLDDVGILDQAVDVTGDVQRSWLIAPGGSTEGNREESEDERETHCEEVSWKSEEE